MAAPVHRIASGVACAVLLVGLLSGGCDQAPGPQAQDGTPPVVSNLVLVPDTATVPADTTTATVQVGIQARVRDPDGAVERVVFTLEPKSSPQSTISNQLLQRFNEQYLRQFELSVPTIKDVYTVRVYAVDDDSLTSNQVLGQFQVVPTP